jgi:dipeptidase E
MKNTQNNKTKLFLSGGGDAQDSEVLDKVFLDSFDGSKLLYIPIAMPGGKNSYESCYDWIVSTLTNISDRFIEIDMCIDLKKLNENILEKYQAVYVGGGNTYKLLQTIEENGFKDLLFSCLEKGIIYYGGSAGAVVIGRDIATVSEENDNNYKFEKGLSLLGKYSVLCHYDGTQDEKIKEYIKISGNSVIAIPEKSGIIVSDLIAKVSGEEPCFIFDKNIKKSIGINLDINF